MKVLGKRISKFLMACYRGPEYPMKMRFWVWLRKSQGYPRLTIPYSGNGWITLDEQDLTQRHILSTGTYEPQVWEALANFIVANEVVWDVGAYIGSFAIRAVLDSRVSEMYAFEPDPINADILAVNLALNIGQYTIYRFALSSQKEKKKLYHGPRENGGLSSLVNQVGSEVFEVDCRSVDELVFQEGVRPPTLMKIDVEGWEYYVLKGAQQVLAELPPKAIVFEAGCDEWGKITNPSVVTYLEEMGYAIWRTQWPSGTIEQRGNLLAVYKTFASETPHGLLPV